MVGDDREADVQAARSQSFVPVHFDGTATALAAPDFETLATLLH
jgi:hypothetical protein